MRSGEFRTRRFFYLEIANDLAIIKLLTSKVLEAFDKQIIDLAVQAAKNQKCILVAYPFITEHNLLRGKLLGSQ